MASISPPNPPAGKLDCSPTKADSPAADAQLSGVLSRLELNDNRSAAPTTPLHDGVNGTGAGAAQNGTFPCYPGPNGTDSATARGVTPALPGSLECSAAQTSKSEETAAMPVTTTIQLGSDTIQIQAKHETPEQAAERAKHSRFMREALDMVSLGTNVFLFLKLEAYVDASVVGGRGDLLRFELQEPLLPETLTFDAPCICCQLPDCRFSFANKLGRPDLLSEPMRPRSVAFLSTRSGSSRKA
jgi:hypothetical protein